MTDVSPGRLRGAADRGSQDSFGRKMCQQLALGSSVTVSGQTSQVQKQPPASAPKPRAMCVVELGLPTQTLGTPKILETPKWDP